MAQPLRSARGAVNSAGRATAGRSSGVRGAEGRRRMMEENAKQEASREASAQMMGMPRRFYCPVGETREVVVIDHEPDWFRKEHNMQNPKTKKWDIFMACLADHMNCVACKELPREAYFALFMTVVELHEYETNDGIIVPWSKRLLVVKSAQQKKIMRLFDNMGEGKSMRGMILQMTRDGDKDAAIGNDIEFVEWMSEDDLLTYEDSYTNSKNEVVDIIGHEPFDYDALFPEPTEQQLRAIVGGRPDAGSRDEERRELGSRRSSGAGRGQDDWDRGTQAARGRAQPAARDRPAADAVDAEQPRQSRAPAPARSARSAAAPEPTQARGRIATRGRTAELPPDEGEPGDPPYDDTAPYDDVQFTETLPPEEDVPVQGRRSATRAAPAAEQYEDNPAPPPRGRMATRGRAAEAETVAAPPVDMAQRRRAVRRN